MWRRSDKINLLCLFLLIAGTGISAGQDTERPLPPLLELVTVNPLNGNTTLQWSPGGSPDVAGYVFYIYRDGAGEAFDTIFVSAATSYIDTRSNADLFSVSYLVAAIDSSDNISPLSNRLSTIFVTAEVDTCNHGIMVMWNSYNDENHTLDYYDITFSVDGGGFNSAGTTSGDTTLFFGPVTTGSDYCFVIEASVNGDRTSRSSMACTQPNLQRPPAWINGDYATVTGGSLLLSFSFDTDSEIETFIIEQSGYPQTGYVPFAPVSSSSGSIEYSVSPVPAVAMYYRLSAINSCGQAVTTSNSITLIKTSLAETSNSVIISWNSYIDWRGGVEKYSVFRSHNGSYVEVANLSAADTAWSDDPYSFVYETTGDSVCYYIVATEGTSPYYHDAESRSTMACMAAPWKVFVPTGFTPDGDGVNDFFRPVLSFTPAKYQMVIISRSGTTLFESRDPLEEWDGTSGGNKLQQDAYLWFLEVVTPGGKTISKHGVITIIFN